MSSSRTPEHAVPEALVAFLERRRPGVDPSAILPVGLDALRTRVEEFIAVDASKFVVLPLDALDPATGPERLADALFDLQT